MSPPAGGRQKLLFLAQTLPYPQDGGAQIRTFNILRVLASRFEVTALCFYRRAMHGNRAAVDEGVEALSDLAHIEAFPIPQEYSLIRWIGDHLASSLTRRVYTVRSYRSAEYEERIRTLVREIRFDLVHVDSLDLAWYLPLVGDAPTVLSHHNVESALLARRSQLQTSFLRREYLRFQAHLMEREEATWAPRVDINATVSAQDARLLAEIAPGARIIVVPNGVDTRRFRPEPRGRDGIVFVGGHTWAPNRDAMDYFATEILPLIRATGGDDVPVRWVGRAPEEVRGRYQEKYAIEMTGYVDSIQSIVGRAACYVVPLRVGGGTRLKILDAWAMGKAVVSTSVGCEGLDARDGENILVRDEPAAFADAVRSVLRDPGLREQLGRAGRRTAEERYDWGVIGHAMMPAYESLVAEA